MLAESVVFETVSPGNVVVGFGVGLVLFFVLPGIALLVPVLRAAYRRGGQVPLDRLFSGAAMFGLLLLGVGGVMGSWLYQDANVSVVLTDVALCIDGGSYGPRYEGQTTDGLPLAALRSSEARLLGPEADGGYATARRTNGLGLPGLLTGWFRLQNGKEAYVYLVGAPETLLLPTTEGYVLLLDVRRPGDLLRRL